LRAVQRYSDGLHVAVEQLEGPQAVAELDQADHYLSGLTEEPAWPTLRAHLLALAVETGEHPLPHLQIAAFVAIMGALAPAYARSTTGRGRLNQHLYNALSLCGGPLTALVSSRGRPEEGLAT
jgi:hypothetical protein